MGKLQFGARGVAGGGGLSGQNQAGVTAKASLWLLLPQPLQLCGCSCPTGTPKLFRNTDFWAPSHLCLTKH